MVFELLTATHHGSHLFYGAISDPSFFTDKEIQTICFVFILYPGGFFLPDCTGTLCLPHFSFKIQYFSNATNE